MRFTSQIARHLVPALGALIVGSSAAMAADPPEKAANLQFSPIQVQHETGCYAGFKAGYVQGSKDVAWTPNALWASAAQSARLQSNGSGNLNQASFVAGGQAGCHKRVNQLVFGAEADTQYTGLDSSRDFTVEVPNVGSGIETYHEAFRSRWPSTFRGQVGWAVQPKLLVYGTGGVVVASVTTTDSVNFPSGRINAVSGTTTRVGWTTGGGADLLISPRWSVKAEYLYVDLGSFMTTSLNSDPLAVNATIDHLHQLKENLVRFGLNFHF